MRLVACLCLLAASYTSVQAQQKIAVDQAEAPAVIKQYIADPGSQATAGRRAGSGLLDRIAHSATVYSDTDESIEAVEVTFVSFDPFGAVLAVTTEMSLDSPRGRTPIRVNTISMSDAADTFHTGVAFVKRVRLEGGQVWEADMVIVMKALRGIDDDFDPALLSD